MESESIYYKDVVTVANLQYNEQPANKLAGASTLTHSCPSAPAYLPPGTVVDWPVRLSKCEGPDSWAVYLPANHIVLGSGPTWIWHMPFDAWQASHNAIIGEEQ